MTVVVDRRSDFTLVNYRRVAFGREHLEVGPAARSAMAAARSVFVELLDSDRSAFIYGTTTRPGIEVTTTVPPERQREYARSFGLQAGHGFGDGCHDEEVVRGIVFARLVDFVEGHAKVRPEIAERVAATLRGPMPRLPLDGQAGPGEVLPMLHLMRALDGVEFEEGEGMAVINGSPYSTAVLADTAIRARHRLDHAETVFALAIDAFRAPLDAYDAALEELWDDPHQIAALRSVRALLDGAEASDRLTQQAPVSLRIVPRLLGEARRAVAEVERAAAGALRSVSVNPVYLPPDHHHRLGRVASNGGFHNATACAVLQSLAASWAELALLAERQIACFHRGPGYGLPPLLNPPGYGDMPAGATNLFGWAVTGHVEAARAAAAPTLLPAIVADAQNDLGTVTSIAHQKERRAADGLAAALAILALVASQALFVTGRRPAPRLDEVVAGVRSVFPPVDSARPRDHGAEAGRLAEVLRAGALTGRLEFPSGRTRADDAAQVG